MQPTNNKASIFWVEEGTSKKKERVRSFFQKLSSFLIMIKLWIEE